MARVAGSATAEIEAPLERVWKVVEDVESAPDWQGGLNAVRTIERDDEGRATLVETETDARLRTIKARVRFGYEPPTRLTWKQEKGDLRSLVGSWELEDLGGAVRALPTRLTAIRAVCSDCYFAGLRSASSLTCW
jgi:uncharacterized membrane protein